MAVILFFTMSFFIFLAGATVLSITFYHWYKTYQEKKQLAASSKN